MSDGNDTRLALPPGWAWATLGELGYWTGGGTPSKSEPAFWTDGSIPWVSPKDMKADFVGENVEKITEEAVKASAAKLVNAGSVVIVTRSGILRHTLPVAIADREVVLNQDLRALTPFDGISARYIQFFLRSQNNRLLHQYSKDGTTVSSINVSRLSHLAVPLAPTIEQSRIATRIEELFGEIEAGEQELEKAREGLETYRRAVLKAAVTGELTKEWREKNAPNETGADLLARILKERRTAWEKAKLAKMKAKGQTQKSDAWKARYQEPRAPDETDLLKLPQGWVWASPEQLMATTRYALAIGPFGSNLKVSDYCDSGVPLIFVRHIRAKSFSGLNAKFVSQSKAEELTPHFVRGGDLLITKMGDPPGDAALYPVDAPEAIITADCIKWTVAEGGSAEFFELAINSFWGRSQFKRITKGVAQRKVTLESFAKIAIPLPPLTEQLKIVAMAKVMLIEAEQVAEDIGRQRAEIRRLRQSVLSAAFTGKLASQDPNDEPASVLLERVRAAAPAHRQGRRVADTDIPSRGRPLVRPVQGAMP